MCRRVYVHMHMVLCMSVGAGEDLLVSAVMCIFDQGMKYTRGPNRPSSGLRAPSRPMLVKMRSDRRVLWQAAAVSRKVRLLPSS